MRGTLPTRVSGLPDLPVEAVAAFDAGLAAIEAPVTIDALARAAILDHLRLLLAWTGAINLTGIHDPLEAVRLHLLDSLTAVPILAAHRIEMFIDIGSGGGYPGIPLALALPARRVLLVESVAKKARFLRVASEAIGAAAWIEPFAGRAEELAGDRRHRERWQAVVARAVGSLAEVAELGLPLLARGGIAIVWKRLPIDEELAAARPTIAALGGGRVSVVGADRPELAIPAHVLVVIEKVSRTPPGFPRDPAVRKHRPL